ncbi:MAG TPA: MerR family transcriptional regulator [Beutenbergiaceae bacterium]|nr:MerR family transcriptional regulator [Beutenbergiaceae bacterium]
MVRSTGDASDEYGEEIRLTVAGVAARLGVAAPTLRTWDRRYGLGPSEHVAGSHRRYAARDIARLETMRRLTLDGVAPADAARIALRDGYSSAAGEADVEQAPSGSTNGRQPAGLAAEAESGPGSYRDAAGALDAAGEGDDDTPVADPLTLAAAAVEADSRRLGRLLRHAHRASGLLETWQMLVRPALEMVVMREHSDRPGSDPDQLLREALLSLVRDTVPAGGSSGPPVAVYPAPDQVLDGHVLGGELAGQGADVRVLHPRLGADGPDVVLDSIRRRPHTLAVLIGVPRGAERIVEALRDADQEVFVISLSDFFEPRPGLHRARTLAGAAHEIMSLITPQNGGRAAG